MSVEMYFTDDFTCILRDILDKVSSIGVTTDKEKAYLTQYLPKVPTLQMLPKVQKDHNKPPFQSIISTRGSIHEPVGQFLDYRLQVRVYTSTFYIKDTLTF